VVVEQIGKTGWQGRIGEAQVDLPDPTQAPQRLRKKRPARRLGLPRSRRRR